MDTVMNSSNEPLKFKKDKNKEVRVKQGDEVMMENVDLDAPERALEDQGGLCESVLSIQKESQQRVDKAEK